MNKYKILSIPLFFIGFLFSVAILNNTVFAGSATLTWNANTEPDLAGYRIYYGTSPRTGACPLGGYANNLSVGNVTSYVFNSLADGQTWYFSVSAYDTSNNASCFSAEVSKVLPAVGDTTAPTISMTAPSSGSTISGTVTVSANASDNVGVVGVQFRLDGTNLGTEDTASPYSISWDTTTASNGSHSLTAIARDAAGNQTTATAVTVTVNNAPADTSAPTVPANLTATAISSSQINLSWTASTDNVGVTGYRIYRNSVLITTTVLASYSNTGLSSSTTYTYTVAAYDAAGNISGQSTAASATTPAPPDTTAPSNVSNLSASNIAQTSLQLNWTAPGDDGNSGTAANYDIRYSLSNITLSNWGSATQVSGEPTPLTAGNAQSMNISGLNAATAYYFAIRTTDDVGNVSGLSNIPSVTTQSFSLSVSLSATPSTGTGSLSNVSLTAAVSGSQTGNINYTFYCNRSDSGTNITTPYSAKYDNQTLTTFTVTNFCSYSTTGTFSPKVIIERGTLAAENRASVVVNAASDITAPTVSITAPLSGTSVSGAVTVSANASDNVGVVGVQFKIDGVSLGTEDAASPYSISWDTTTASNGSHVLTATARDAAENQTISNSVSLTVNNTIGRLAKPSKVKNPRARQGSIILEWDDPGYAYTQNIVVLRRTDTFPQDPLLEPAYVIATLGPSITSYTDSQAVNNVTYYYSIFTRDDLGIYSDPATVSFMSVPATTSGSGGGGGGGGGAPADTTPPSVPSNTKISMSGNQVVITWSNPTDTDFRGITIIRKQNSSPTSKTDGNIVYNNNLQNFIDSIDSAKTFYYAVYSYDTNNNYSQPVILKAEPGQTSVVSQPTSTTQPATTISPTVLGTGQIVIPSSVSSFTFTQHLIVGKSGDEVKKLQELLFANPSIYPQQQITGYYGSATQKAVQKLQEMYGVANSSNLGYGEVGPSTRKMLNALISTRGAYSPSTYSTSTASLTREQLIQQLKALIQQIEAKILILLQQLKQIRGY